MLLIHVLQSQTLLYGMSGPQRNTLPFSWCPLPVSGSDRTDLTTTLWSGLRKSCLGLISQELE